MQLLSCYDNDLPPAIASTFHSMQTVLPATGLRRMIVALMPTRSRLRVSPISPSTQTASARGSASSSASKRWRLAQMASPLTSTAMARSTKPTALPSRIQTWLPTLTRPGCLCIRIPSVLTSTSHATSQAADAAMQAQLMLSIVRCGISAWMYCSPISQTTPSDHARCLRQIRLKWSSTPMRRCQCRSAILSHRH